MANEKDKSFPWGAVALGALYLSSVNHRKEKPEKWEKLTKKDRKLIDKMRNDPSLGFFDKIMNIFLV